jgi:formate/nitrite transporter FocA (FNT family)
MVRRLLVALVYPLGFVLCLMSGSELFTEHTATAVYPVLDGRSSLLRLLRLWGVVAGGNLVGTLASACLLWFAEDVIEARTGYETVVRHLLAVDTMPLLGSAVIAGWLMALGAWLILATPPTLSQIVCVYIVTFLIGLGGLHHSVAGAAEVFAGLCMGSGVTIAQSVRFIALALLGNLIGGSIFVAVLNYGHIRQTRAVSKPAQT